MPLNPRQRQGGVKSIVLPEQDLVRRILALVPLPRRANLHYHGLWAPNAHDRAEVVPARGDLAKHRAQQKAAKAKRCRTANEGKPDVGPPADERAADTRMKWAECLRRAFHFDVLQCPCGGRRKVLAAVTDGAQVERILRHVGLWRDGGDVDAEIVAIRGPPDIDLWPVDEAPSAAFDGWDEPGALDDAA